MESKAFQTKVNAYTDVIKKHLYTYGINYEPGQNNYFFVVDGQSHHLAIKGGMISIANIDANTAEHYIFSGNNKETVFEHYKFTSEVSDNAHITHSAVSYEDDSLVITSGGASLNMENWPDNCANKIVFFSDSLLGESLYDTLDKVYAYNESTPVTVIQDLPKKVISEETLLPLIESYEEEILHSLNQKQTR